jgi:hypothetical protein
MSMVKKNSNITMVVVLVLALMGFVYVAIIAPKPVDWSLSYSNKDEIPLGGELLYSVLPALFPEQSLVSMHNRLEDFLEGTTPLNTNFIYITDAYNPDAKELEKLLEVVNAGNRVFIAAEVFSQELRDSLKLELEQSVQIDPSLYVDSVSFNFANRKLSTAYGYWFKKAITDNTMVRYDSTKTTVLGYNTQGKTNFIRVQLGAGFLYLHGNPMVFTNYHLLSGSNSEYLFKSLSYLPVASTVWDEFYKPGKAAMRSELQYILNDRALRMAWYILLFGIVVYFVFKGKRRQRAIPVVIPPKNNTLDFVETVGRLYFVRQNHKGIAQKRFVFFLDFLRTRYYVDTSSATSKLVEEVSKKSGIHERTVNALFKVAGNLEKVRYISQEDLQQFNRQIEYFYKNCR